MTLPVAAVDAIDAILPQTQCTKCGYAGCRPYAQALAEGSAALNRCPPGGDAGIRKLAALLERPYLPLDPAVGVARSRHVALIDETRCIGCTLCIQACPVDAIVGAAKLMHTVYTDYCSGCDLCVAPCPVDCITMVPAVGDDAEWTGERMDAARHRHLARAARLARDETAEAARLDDAAARSTMAEHDAKRAMIADAVRRAKEKRAARP